jgi:tRNA (adenine57-N1/adenine58-N1)-methyltransferase
MADLRDFPDQAYSGVHHGPLQEGEWITLQDSKGRRHSVFLERGKIFHTTKGGIAHDELIDGPDAVVIRSKGGVEYLALRPLMADYSVSMPRGAAVI